MQITIPRGELKVAVAGFIKVVNGRSHTLPILGGVRFESSKARITAQVTDLEQHLRYRFGDAQAQGDGAFIMPLANLKDLVHGKAQETICFETGEKGSVTVTNHVGDHEVKHPVQGLDVDDWPSIPADVATKPADGFLDTYRRLVAFASTDSTRYTLNSVYVDVADKGEHPVTMVATDGRRLTCWNTMNLPLPKSVVVPTTKFLSWTDLKGDVAIGLRTQQKKELCAMGLSLSVGPWFYEVKAVDGQYPNWRQVIPGRDDTGTRITFTDEDAALFKKALLSFPHSGEPLHGIELHPGAAGRLNIVGKGPENKEATTLALTGGSTYEGSLSAIGVDGFFLCDALDAGFRTFAAAAEMCALRSDDGKGGTHILMPQGINPATTKKASPMPEPGGEPTNGDGITSTPGQVPQTGTTATPATQPAEEDHKPKGETKPMESTTKGTTETMTALDRLQAAYEVAKVKVREANQALADVAGAIKEAVKEDKQLRADVENVRTGLAKIQSIKV